MKKFLLLTALTANASFADVDCNTNCKDHSRYKYACGTSGWPPKIKYCKGTNYSKMYACQTIRTAQGCGDFDIIGKTARLVIKEAGLEVKAEREGWTKSSCDNLAVGITGTIVVFKSAAICSWMAGAGTPLVGAACAGAVGGMIGTVSATVCIQLCHDRHLLDCK